jgi:hypothetical protein
MRHTAQPGGSSQGSAVIAGWKGIGRYLGKGTRTVQRWEHDLGLPVRRSHDGSKPGIMAVPAEIDAWVQARRLRSGELIDPCKFEREQLLQSLEELRSENGKLRWQLEIERAKKSK